MSTTELSFIGKKELTFERTEIDVLLSDIRAQAMSEVFDVTTAAGRKACASMAYKIRRSKTHIDSAGKSLCADWKAKAKAVDEDRRRVRKELDRLVDEVRRPLDEWEAAKAAEEKRQDDEINRIKALGHGHGADGSVLSIEDIDDRLLSIRALSPPALAWLGDRKDEAQKEAAYSLKAMQAERIIRVAADRAKKEREAAEKAEAEKRIQSRIAAEKAKALEQAERQHKEAIARRERETQEAIVQERLKAERDARQAAQAVEAQRLAEAEARRAEEQAKADIIRRKEQAAAAAAKDEQRREHVHGEIFRSLVDAGVGPHSAGFVVATLARGGVPYVRIEY